MHIYQQLLNELATGKKLFAMLLDPQEVQQATLIKILPIAEEAHVDIFLIGGSLVGDVDFSHSIDLIKSKTQIPVLLFPGHHKQIYRNADAILLLSLISGRNPEYLIGQHVQSSQKIKQMQLEPIPTGYMLMDSGSTSSVQYISGTLPIPVHKPDIAVATAFAGQQLGMKMIYLEAGSGAKFSVPEKIVQKVKEEIEIPLMVGGGIRTVEKAASLVQSGADIVVVGNALESTPELMYDMSLAIHSISKTSTKWRKE